MNFDRNELDAAELEKRIMILECLKENAANMKVERQIMNRQYLEAYEEHEAGFSRSKELYAEGRVDEADTMLDKVSKSFSESNVHFRRVVELGTQFGETIRTFFRICEGMPLLPRIESIINEFNELVASSPHLVD